LDKDIELFNTNYLLEVFTNNLYRIIVFSFFISFLSLVSSFLFQKSYMSEATIISSSSSDFSSNLDGVTDLLGLGGARSTDRKVVEAVATLQSRDFISNFLMKYGLVDYVLKNSKIDIEKLRQPKNFSTRDNSLDKSKIDELTSKFKKKFISIDQTDKDGLIILSLSAKKAEHSQIVLSLIIKELEQTMKNRYLKDKENTMLSLERILIESQDNATKKIVQRIYNNEQSAFISGKTKENLIFEIIDAPHLPGKFYFPSRLRFLIFGFIFGFIFSYIYFFRKRTII
tara:strand:- start:381 stop:1235 length:855 start_codon:yes stop_codon:yes gene_type:complete